MTFDPMAHRMFGRAFVALAVIAYMPVSAAELGTPAVAGAQPSEAHVVVAQASANAGNSMRVMESSAFPAYQRGVREAAAQGNEALRRYIWRTRMIYNFYYNDFAAGA